MTSCAHGWRSRNQKVGEVGAITRGLDGGLEAIG